MDGWSHHDDLAAVIWHRVDFVDAHSHNIHHDMMGKESVYMYAMAVVFNDMIFIPLQYMF